MKTINGCQWTQANNKPGYWICESCGIPYGGPRWKIAPTSEPPKVYRSCRGEPRQSFASAPQPVLSPGFTEKAMNWFNATAAWVAAGRPVRSAEEQATLAEICRPCKYYKPDPVLPLLQGGQCGVCGCGIAPERKLLNALSYATYRCKQGYWDDAPVTFVTPPPPTKENFEQVMKESEKLRKVD